MTALAGCLLPLASDISRVQVVVRGAVQGVGFRPFIYTLAKSHRIDGWVLNTPNGVIIEAEGPLDSLTAFVSEIRCCKPAAAVIDSLEETVVPVLGVPGFEIRESRSTGQSTTTIMADLATCPSCLQEMSDPKNRRFRYPFTNCTHCGPRYSIILDLPYDRPNTTMRDFIMCSECQAEYENPLDRRFHAQPIACPICGPHLALWNGQGVEIAAREDALLLAISELRSGAIVAIKGIGGYQIVADAMSEETVKRLRSRKQREEKPFAVLFPSIQMADEHCVISPLERNLLKSSQAPIVIVERRSNSRLPDTVAPGNPDCGIMLPYSPLHYLLAEGCGRPLIATSGNLSEQPIVIDESAALSQLAGIADYFLVHNRPIARQVDDSVVRIIAGRETVLRRARGYAPLSIPLAADVPPLLAVGAHQKSAIGLSVGRSAIMSQHIGDLDTVASSDAYERVVADLTRMYGHQPVAIACDEHPDYRSTSFARSQGILSIPVQHHYAHILSCMADNRLTGEVLGIAWDGTGYGSDQTIWGGEFLKVNDLSYERFASLLPFRLPGGEAAVHEPRRTALGLLFACFGDSFLKYAGSPLRDSFSRPELKTLTIMLQRGIHSPITTSMGRLFDGVAALLNIRWFVRHEGQAAMELEYRARESDDRGSYTIPLIDQDESLHADWRPMISEILYDKGHSRPLSTIARRFHNSLAELAVTVSHSAGIQQIALSGGCFQNRLLTELCTRRLSDSGFSPYWHHQVPPNDGGIALGQLIAASRQLAANRIESKSLCV